MPLPRNLFSNNNEDDDDDIVFKLKPENLENFINNDRSKVEEEEKNLPEEYQNHPEDDNRAIFTPCIICMSDKREATFVPCGHICCCMGCAQLIKNKKPECPFCKKPFIDFIRFYVP